MAAVLMAVVDEVTILMTIGEGEGAIGDESAILSYFSLGRSIYLALRLAKQALRGTVP